MTAQKKPSHKIPSFDESMAELRVQLRKQRELADKALELAEAYRKSWEDLVDKVRRRR